MYSINVNGEMLDFRYKKQNDFTYAFYIGDILIGQLFKHRKNSWTAVSYNPHEFNGISGFNSRHSASEYLLRINGYYPKNY